MMQGPDSRVAASVSEWLAGWGAEVAAVDLATARERFDAGVVAFGTHADIVSGLDALHDQQWRLVWPTIEDFSFRLDEMVALASPDGLQAVAVVGWDSTGIDANGRSFDRPGRATIVLRRNSLHGEWRGVHTHFSLGRDVPTTSHGDRTPS
jgi:ketosteroid isomerase-like protein